MKTIMHITLSMTILAALGACGDAQNKAGTETPTSNQQSQHEHSARPTAGDKVNDQPGQAPTSTNVSIRLKDDLLNAVYTQYTTLTAALVKGHTAQAKIAANAIEAGAREMAGGGDIATYASAISMANNLDEQREQYARLSNRLIELIRTSGLTQGVLYTHYCPMAMDDKGAYWLSTAKEIRNPYFGDRMLTCGEISDTIR